MRVPSKTWAAGWVALAYVPMLLSRPGRVSADSKQYLYLDPAGLFREANHLWDPSVGAGGVPHQGLGYLFPVAPFFWLGEAVGLPDWVVQRLWLGSLLLAALVGARWLLGQLGVGRAGAVAGALIYGLTPYQLAFEARISVLLLPWAALPWLVGWTMRATRVGGWRPPAMVAVVLLLTGGVNASSLLLVALGPAAWLALEAVRRPRPALRATGAIAVLGGGVSLWWLVGLRLQGAYGLPVLQLTEKLPTVAAASDPADVLRGLGNWFFTGRDRRGYAVAQAADYETDRLVMALSFAVPMAGLAAAFVVRWAHRTYFGLLVVLGSVVAVGSWPIEDPSPYGRAWRAFAEETSFGLAFRNSPRAVPLVVLGLAGLLGAAVGALPRPPVRRVAAGVVAVLAVGALLPVADGGFLAPGLDRPEDIPQYWREAGQALDDGDHGTRILELPGASFAVYGWGNTVDPLTPGLTERPYLAREVLPAGTVASVNLLEALDRRIQLGTFEAASLVPIARLFGVGTISVRADLDRSGRFDSPPVERLWDALQARPPGLGAPTGYGPPGGDGSRADLQAVELFPVEDATPIVRTRAEDAPMVVAGDGDGLVDAAAAGLVSGDELVLYEASLDDDALDDAVRQGARLVLTDSNRRRAQTWFYAIGDTRGRTEQAGETAPDPTGYDERLDLFPGTGDDARTVVSHLGGTVHATMEGGPERPEDKAVHAVDGDPTSAWRVGGDPVGATLTIEPDDPQRVDAVTVVQPPGPRGLTRIRLVVDGGAPLEVDLGPASRAPGGQRIPLGDVTEVHQLRIEVLAADPHLDPSAGAAPVGLAEVVVGEARIEETVRPPRTLLERLGAASGALPLDLVLTRLRSPDPARQDEERRLDRTIELPTSRAFTIGGLARGTGLAADGACRADLLEIDGDPVEVRVGPGAVAGEVELTGCVPVTLGPGSHRVTGARASDRLAVDRLVLSSEGTAPTGSGVAPPEVTVTANEFDHLAMEVDATSQPFWLVLGQSDSAGWTIEVQGAAAGERQLVDGYANGWLLTPTGDGPITVALRWAPQRLVTVGLLASGLALLVVVAILWRARRSPVVELASAPSLRRWDDDARAWAHTARDAGAGTLLALLVATPVVGLMTATLLVAAGATRRGWVVLVVAAPGAVAASRVLDRPSLAWLAVTLLAGSLLRAADPVVSRPRGPTG